MNHVALAQEVYRRSLILREAHESGRPLTADELADDGELLFVLARIVAGMELNKAFGPPGDWGYEHPIGKALHADPPAGVPK